jgi:[protein-PII] uridylyltransferase
MLPPGESLLDGADDLIDREAFLLLSRNYLSILKESLPELRARAAGGKAFVQSYSRMVDAIVGLLFQRAAHEHSVSTEKAGVAIIGLGGYGRTELAPHSDVDILIVCRRKTQLVKKIATVFIQLMWDVGFELGHSMESLVESEGALFRHMDTRTALFESRWICGSRRIAREVERRVSRFKRKDRQAFLERKIKDAIKRHKKYGNSYQLIEPNVKLSPGGLRDFQTLMWLGMVVPGAGGLSALRKRGLLLPGEEKTLLEAYDFLLKVRVELHLATMSKQDQLSLRMQKLVAERLGYGGKGQHLAVELFMKKFYTHTRNVFRITEDVIEELRMGKSVGVLLGQKKPSGDGNKLFVRVDRRKIVKTPLYVFEKQKEAGLKLDRAVKLRLESMLGTELKDKAQRRRMRRDFSALFENDSNLSLVLRSMHETGFLGAIIPEYNELTSLKRYDLYHHYTVDEHSFKVIKSLELLSQAGGVRSNPLARLYSEIADKQVLFLAALLHDVGKIEGRGHARKGAVLSRKILKRLSYKPAGIKAVSYLIEIHLLMSHFSQRRDVTDLQTLRSFCARVRNRTNLKYLCLLTYADLNATSPLVWTEWKRSLLWALYLRAYEYMAKKEKQPDAVYKARKRAILRAFPKGADRDGALEHLDRLPGRYLLTMNPAQVKQHMRLIDKLDGGVAEIDFRRRRLSTEITFCTPDKPFRLSQLCGVLTLNDCNILHANAFTRRDKRVIDVFHVQDLSGTVPIDEKRIENIHHDLVLVLKGKLDISRAVEDHIVRWKRKRDTTIPIPFKVEFENDISGDVTIIDIFAMDEPGLLFRITRALSQEGLQIHRARISTEANRVIDSFDVQNLRGEKITSVSKLRKIRTRLEKDLSPA